MSLRRAIAGYIGDADPGEAAELLWATWHGLVSLRAAGRIPPHRIEAHIAPIARMWD
ncbi:TetR-like C-terminal domain-containing protein [Pseudactinotalea sp. Z1748]|uniref:TetR-like C-terminal domain-containing protein n=1 Tax=Pseudactinotalea sp. Z1748 TaxID=3413027 RepID=UPI003C7D6E80